ncbi:HNH endonuclease [Microvirga vignae]|uniref:HNH endonuclease n=1 Tax=Microvirga vignae TaxID=1225564 RepID=A0A0H1R7J6_9HYPH|nr:HNH endonuclease domain-containing protein [Microvirga vignae]KLK91029.1 HNH endonuclease [Microvirga vignae]
MTRHFLDLEPTLENQWRAIILFGRNAASYKFALSKALLSLSPSGELIKLEELALPFAREVCAHLKIAPRQATNSSSRFLEACKRWNAGELTDDQLRNATAKLGFVNVIDAFHNLDARELPNRFFVDERRTNGGIRLTDDFWRLNSASSPEGLKHETESRWRLVETAWELGLSRSLIAFDDQTEDLFVSQSHRRQAVTSCRHALNGYQKGHCFYCFAPISIVPGETTLADVDHFIPHVLKRFLPGNLDGVWNLVLACVDCNRGTDGKSDRIPSVTLLSRLHARNEYLIQSHHPLRETLMLQTGRSAQERSRFLQAIHTEAKQLRIHDWKPEQRGSAVFDVN